MLKNKISELIIKQDWRSVEEIIIPIINKKDDGLEATLIYCGTLRIRLRGKEANEILKKSTLNNYSAPLITWAQYTEELIQSGLWHEAKKIIIKLQKEDEKVSDLLKIIFFRETENWNEIKILSEKYKKDNNPQFEIQFVWTDLKQGFIKNANTRLEKFKDNEHVLVLKMWARYYIYIGDLNKALKIIIKIKNYQKNDWEALALEGVCRRETAIELWNESLQRQPAQCETIINRARYYAANSKWEKITEACEAASQIKPWSDLPILMMIELYVHENKINEALIYLEKNIKVLNTPKRISAKLDLLRGTLISKSALLELADNAIKIYPNNSDVLLSAGAAFQLSGNFDRAALCYQDRIKNDPDDINTLNNLAQIYLDRGDVEKSVAIWKNINVNRLDIQMNYANALFKRGDIFDSEKIYIQAIKINDGNNVAKRGLAEIAITKGNYELAWNIIKDTLLIDRHSTKGWIIAAEIQKYLGSLEKVEKVLKDAEKFSRNKLPIRQQLFQLLRSQFKFNEIYLYIDKWKLEDTTNEIEYILMLADISSDQNEFNKVEKYLKYASTIDWKIGDPLLVKFYESRNEFKKALKIASQLVKRDFSIMKHHGLKAEVLYRQRKIRDALDAIEVGLGIEPFRLSLYRQKIGILLSEEQYNEAILASEKLIEHEVSISNLRLLITTYNRTRNFRSTELLCRNLVKDHPENRVYKLWLAESLINCNELEDALLLLNNLWNNEKSNLNVANTYINLLILTEDYIEALSVATQTLEYTNLNPDSILNISQILINMKNYQDALDIVDKGLVNFPKNINLHKQKFEILNLLKLEKEAFMAVQVVMDSFSNEHALPWAWLKLVNLEKIKEAENCLTNWQKSDPTSLNAKWNSYSFAKKMRRYQTAYLFLDIIEKRSPYDPNIFIARADLHSEAWRMSEAISLVRKVCDLHPLNYSYLITLLNLQVKYGDFDDFNSLFSKISHLLGDQIHKAYQSLFFNINCHPSWSSNEIYKIYNDWYIKSILPSKVPNRIFKNSIIQNRKLKIGYISPDFRRHAVAFFSEPLLINHDRLQFELFGFYHLDKNAADQYTSRFKSYFDHWLDITDLNLIQIEKLIIENDIDILIDLAGHTSNNSLATFIRKPAPIQVSYLFGAGQTTGLPEVDYLISDSLAIPTDHEKFISEKVIRLPFPGVPYIPSQDYLEPAKLPFTVNGFITFGVMSRPLRTNRKVIAVWADILRKLPNAKLLFDHIPYAEIDLQNRFKKIFKDCGINENQLIFQNTRPHWKAYHQMDVQLDTFPAGSGTTITEGLWMERVAIALNSRPPMGRIAVSQLIALGLEADCCAISEDDYVTKAVALARDTQKLTMLSIGLRNKMKTSRLMNYKKYAIDVADCYRQMWIEYCQSKGMK